MIKMAERMAKCKGANIILYVVCSVRILIYISFRFIQTINTLLILRSCSGKNDEIKMFLSSIVLQSDKKERNKKKQTPIFSDSAS